VEASYILAWKLKTKGLTVYRDGSRSVQVLTTGTKDDKKKETETEVEAQSVIATGIRIIPRERPDVVHGSTYRIKTAYGKLFVTINDDEEGMPFEMFSTLGKTGGFFASNTEAICRLISLALRAGIDPEEVIDQIKGIRGPQPTWGEDGKMILSLPDAIGQLLERHINRAQPNLNLNFNTPEPQKVTEEKVTENLESINPTTEPTSSVSLADLGEAPACGECGSMLIFTEGCLKCSSCGYSKCS
jgi:ribonucleoside-diphosphate reductase alpha chain